MNIKQLLADHLGLLVGASTTLYVFVKLLAVAGGDARTALAILQASGTATVVIGALMPLAQPLIVALLGLPVYVAIQPKPVSFNVWVSLAVLPFLTASVLVTEQVEGDPEGMWIGIAGFIMFESLLALRLSWKFNRPYGRMLSRIDRRPLLRYIKLLAVRGGPVIVAATALTTVVFTAASGVPWVPSEVIEVRRGRPFTAYVLNDNVGNLVVLSIYDRRVQRISRTSVEARQICSTKSSAGFLLRYDEDRYTPCP